MIDSADSDETLDRAARILRRSRIASLVDAGVRRSEASIRQSRARACLLDRVRRFQSLPLAEQARCGLIAMVAAMAGHVVFAAMLPAAARPTLGFSAIGLLGASLAAAVAARRR